MRLLPAVMNPRLAKKRILLVDDEAGFTRLLKVNLERSGRYVLREENDATKALEAAVEFQPDLILLDVVMPKMDGANLCHQIRRDPRLQGVQIVFLTGSIQKSEDGWTSIGGFPAVAKPIGVSELVMAIEAALAKKEPGGRA